MMLMAVSVLLLSLFVLVLAQFDLDKLLNKSYALKDLSSAKNILIAANSVIFVFLASIILWKNDIT